MANALYDAGRNAFLTGDIDWVADDIRCVLVDTATYAVNLATHTSLADIPAAERVASTTASMTGKTATAGVADAADVTFPAVSGDPSEALVIYKHNATESLATLIAYIDSATGLPVTPNGGDITVTWGGAPNFIFKL